MKRLRVMIVLFAYFGVLSTVAASARDTFKLDRLGNLLQCQSLNDENTEYHCGIAETSQCSVYSTYRQGTRDDSCIGGGYYCFEYTAYTCTDGTSYTESEFLGCRRICR